MKSIDSYLNCCLQRSIKGASESYETTKFRTAAQHALFDNINSLRWYLKRVNRIENANKKTLSEFIENMIKLIAPLSPHFCEELWSMLGKKTFIATEKFPVSNES